MKKRPALFWAVLIFLAIVAPISVLVLSGPQPTTTRPHVRAAPFIWPQGCPRKKYNDSDAIPRSCIIEDNRFRDWPRYGLPSFRGSSEYYRIGNDAVLAECGFYKTCTAQFVVEDAFFQ
jgi:hypothetical protein